MMGPRAGDEAAGGAGREVVEEVAVGSGSSGEEGVELDAEEEAELRQEVIAGLDALFTERTDVAQDMHSIASARVPLIKFVHVASGLPVDINVNNELGLINTRLLRAYVDADPRFHKLGFVLKKWAKTCKINDASMGYMSSYALIMLLIHFLQTRPQPVLPYLQQLEDEEHPRTAKMHDGWDCYYFADSARLSQVWASESSESVGALLIGFFRYYGGDFDFAENVVCVRSAPGLLAKADKKWGTKPLCIEDPFDRSHNLTKGIGKKAFRYILDCLRHAYEHFSTCAAPEDCGPEAAHEAFFDQAQMCLEAPPPGGFRCYICQDETHRAAECPKNPKNRECHRCGEVGHLSRSCPTRKPRTSYRSGGTSSGTSRSCYNCGQPGHLARDCRAGPPRQPHRGGTAKW